MIKSFFIFISNTFNALSSLFLNKGSKGKKVRIFFAFIKITFKLLFLRTLLGIKIQREKTLGFVFNFFDYDKFFDLFREIFVKQCYFFESEKINPKILDCGSNLGMATFFFKYYYPKAEIDCFEPDKETYKVLVKNIRENNFNKVGVHNCGLSNKEGLFSFFVKEDENGCLNMSFSKFPGSQKASAKLEELSGYIKGEIDLLKLDVEGEEFNVLSELSKTKKISLISQIIMEYHHKVFEQNLFLSQILALFEKEGFEYKIDFFNCLAGFSNTDIKQPLLVKAWKNYTI